MSMETRRPPTEPPDPRAREELELATAGPLEIDGNPSALLPIVDDLSDGVFTLDAQGRIVSWSAGAERLTGYSCAETQGHPLSMLRGPECRGMARAMELLRDPAGHEGLRWQECRIRCRDGRAVQLLGNLRLVRDRKGRVIGAVGSLSDLTSWVLGGGATLLDTPIAEQDELDGLVGRGESMQNVFQRVRAAAASELPVLVRGEPGTGRSHVARLAQARSARAEAPLEVVECAGRNERELAAELFGGEGRPSRVLATREGTLLLEEIQELPRSLQGRLVELARRGLVRLPDEQLGDIPSGVRLIATATDDLDERVDRGMFLPELRAELRGLEIALPPLRERRIDVPLVVRKLVGQLGRERGLVVREISREALEVLVQHPWPGNVRQLRGALAHALDGLRGERVTLLHLPAEVRGALVGPRGPEGGAREWSSEERLERARLVEALERQHWNRTRTARDLGISRVTLWKRIRRLGLDQEPEPVP